MPLTPQGTLPFKHVDQVDQPTPGTYTPTELKIALDSTPEDLKTTINNMITILLGTTDADSGADNIGATAITDLTGNTVQELLESLKALVDSQLPTPDGSITNTKLATDIKVGSLAALTTTDKSSVVAAVNEHLAEDVTLGDSPHGMGSIASQTYEEGTFTPIITFGGVSTGITYASRLGRYTRTGRIIHCEILIILSSKGTATGIALLGGFPFVTNAGPPTRATTIGVTQNITYPTDTKNIALIQSEGSTAATFQASRDTTVINLDDTNFGDTSRLFTQLTYEI